MIDLDQARDLLKRAVETQGREFVYNPGGKGECRYEPLIGVLEHDPRGKTGCLIGVALDLAGETRHRTSTDSIWALAQDNPGWMTAEAQAYFCEAQARQDGGTTWGEAYDEAEAYVALLVANV